MYISNFQINNYKSFLSPQEVHFSPGFNVLVAQNNAGKTALLEALSLNFSDKPHKSMKTMPSPGVLHGSPISSVHIAFQLSKGEAEQLLMNARSSFNVPTEGTNPERDLIQFLKMLPNAEMLDCSYQQNAFVRTCLKPQYEPQVASRPASGVEIRVNALERRFEYDNPITGWQGSSDGLYGFHLARMLRDRIYMFKAERLNISQSQFGLQTRLASDASNLAEVLHTLQSSNPAPFNRLNDHVNTIFPEIKRITG